MADQLNRFLHDQSGATAIEYCMIASVIAMAIIGGLTTVGTKLNQFFVQIAAAN